MPLAESISVRRVSEVHPGADPVNVISNRVRAARVMCIQDERTVFF